MSLNDSPKTIFEIFFSVAGFKKKIVVFLITVALGGGALLVPAFAGITPLQKQDSAQSSTEGTESEKSKFDPFQPQTEGGSETGSLFANDPNFSGKSGYNTGSGEFFFRAMLAVLFVVVLGVAAIYVSKKLLPKITNLPGKEIRIVETVHLGPRKAVHLIEIGNQRFLIGSTNENVTKLADITSNLTDLTAHETNCN
ncbi:MAG: flagellar biosynthetic protein FliO [Planctomycetota bacterium]|jgi:flagellar biosynthetic protein FliO